MVQNLFNRAFVEVQTAKATAFRKDEGQGLVEYGLIIGLVAIACVGALGVLSGKIDGLMSALSFDAPAD